MKVDAKQLREFLLDAGLVDEVTANKALAKAEKSKKELGTILLEMEAIEEEDLRKMYAYILGIPYVDLEKEKIPKDILQLIPEPIASKTILLLFRKTTMSFV